jgi:hypothetical protein
MVAVEKPQVKQGKENSRFCVPVVTIPPRPGRGWVRRQRGPRHDQPGAPHPRARKQDGDGAPHRPRPRVTPPRLLLRHAVRRMAWHTGWKGRAGEVMLGPGPGVGGAQGQPVRRHHRGRGHNTHIRHGYLPSSSTGHRTHPAPTPYAPTPVESTPVTPARWPPRGRERMQRITCTTHPQPSAHHSRGHKKRNGDSAPAPPPPRGSPRHAYSSAMQVGWI